jgi:hypothetical protein
MEPKTVQLGTNKGFSNNSPIETAEETFQVEDCILCGICTLVYLRVPIRQVIVFGVSLYAYIGSNCIVQCTAWFYYFFIYAIVHPFQSRHTLPVKTDLHFFGYCMIPYVLFHRFDVYTIILRCIK